MALLDRVLRLHKIQEALPVLSKISYPTSLNHKPSMHVVGSILLLALLTIGQHSSTLAQPAFDKAEFAARRAKVFEKIGDGMAIIFANDEHPHSVRYREAPDFFYLTGVEEPGAVLVLLGKQKQAFIAAPKKPEWIIQSEGPRLRDIPDAAKIYGINKVSSLEKLKDSLDLQSGV